MGNKTSKGGVIVKGEPEPDSGAHLAEDQPVENNDAQSMIMIANIESQIKAAVYQGNASCSVHEKCDGSCGGLDALFEPIIVGPTETGLEIQTRPSTRPSGESTTPFVIDGALEEFNYTALDPARREIRLLSVKGAIFRADPVDCTLDVFSLDSAPEYTALSYCWGTDPPGKRILCNGKVYMVRPSLEGALKRYRNAASKVGPRFIHGTPEYLWADAICIDQDNIPEKSNQLPLMQKIYRKANMVFVDLGDVEPDWYCGYDLILRADGICGKPNLEMALPSPNHLAWGAYWYIFMQPWFTREWIVEEITLAQYATVMFGRFIWTWEELEKSFSVLSQGTTLHSYMSKYGAAGEGILNFLKIKDIRKNYIIHHLPEYLETVKTVLPYDENPPPSDPAEGSYDSLKLVQLTRDFFCSDPRDKIFALYALMEDVESSALGDYSSTVAEVYTRFALHHIHRGHAFLILDYAGLHRKNLDAPIPSWVPDWTGQGRANNSKRPIASLRNMPFSASKGTEADVQVPDESANNLRLVIKGQILDTLRVVQHQAAEPVDDVDGKSFLWWHSKIRALLDSSLQLCSSIYKDLDDAFARLLLVDDLYTGDNKIEWETSITNPTATYKRAIERVASDKDIRRRQGSTQDEVETFKTQMFVACHSRSFAISDQGYISLVPMLAKEGDIICICRGSPVPYILRKTLDGVGYFLVGDAYVHGVMYGEAITDDSIDIALL
jgi:hypothetical protein